MTDRSTYDIGEFVCLREPYRHRYGLPDDWFGRIYEMLYCRTDDQWWYYVEDADHPVTDFPNQDIQSALTNSSYIQTLPEFAITLCTPRISRIYLPALKNVGIFHDAALPYLPWIAPEELQQWQTSKFRGPNEQPRD